MISGPAGFADQLAGGTEFTADQSESLIKAMSEERQNFKFSTDYSDRSKLTADFTSSFTEENINRNQQEQGQLNQLYLTRAQTVLSPDQLAAFQKFLANRQEIAATMLRMSAKMYGAKIGGN